MIESEKTFCNTHCRHLRLLFLVDDQVGEKFLIDLFVDNYQLWGGRYNPVIPVHDQNLNAYYSGLIDHFDPDFIFYSEKVGLETAQRICKNLHPAGFRQLDPNGRNNFPGVYAHYLLPEAQRQAGHFMRNFSLVYFQRHEVDPQTTFYNLSFGIINQYVEDMTLASGYQQSILNVSDIAETNRRIAEEKPFFNGLLSTQQPEFIYLKPTSEWEINCLEFIIYDENDPFDDLIYFWNRVLSQQPRGEILQLIASKTQLDLLLADGNNLGTLLRSLARDNSVYFHSLSLPHAELEGYRAHLQTTYPGVAYKIANTRSIPRISHSEIYPYRRELQITKNLLIGNKDYIKFPAPYWSADRQVKCGNYVYDAEFFQETDQLNNFIKFPYGTVVQYILGRHEARVNKAHHASFFLDAEKQGLDIQVPRSADIFYSRLQSRITNGEKVDLPVRNLRISDAGLKLNSFVKLFDGKLFPCDEVLKEKFWVDLILGQSSGSKKKRFEFKRMKDVGFRQRAENFMIETPISNIHNNDGTFNHLDLEAERKLIYLEHASGIKEWLAAHDQHFNDDELLEFMTKSAADDFKNDIDIDLQYLIDRDALFIGTKVKCKHCGSNSWYTLAELKNKMSCKGCLQEIIPMLESRLYYRFNDIVYNNLSSDPVRREKSFHGNYIVLRTLAAFSRSHGALESFLWSASLDIGIKSGNGFIGTDIDIAMIQQGKLIIGEAKASASDFNAKQFEQLQLMAEAIRPDAIILAYLNGTINIERLNRLKENAAQFDCKVITHQVAQPHYFIGRIK